MKRDYNLTNAVIKVEWLKKYSDENYGILNRSLDVNAMIEAGIDEIRVLGNMPHSYAFGQPHRFHFRLILEGGLTQDLYLEQLRELVEKVYQQKDLV